MSSVHELLTTYWVNVSSVGVAYRTLIEPYPYTSPPPPLGRLPYTGTTMLVQRCHNVVQRTFLTVHKMVVRWLAMLARPQCWYNVGTTFHHKRKLPHPIPRVAYRTLMLQCWYNVGTTLYHIYSQLYTGIGCKMAGNARKSPMLF